jgi:hypothetical protein
MKLLAALASLLLPIWAGAAANKTVALPTTPVSVVGPVVPAVTLPGAQFGAKLPTLPYGGADLRYDPAAMAAMANPVPATAIGLKASYFQPLPAGAAVDAQAVLPQAAANADGKNPAGAFESSRRVADAVSQVGAPAAASNVSNSVFDGLLARGELTGGPVYAGTAGPAKAASLYSKTGPLKAQGLQGEALLRQLHEKAARGFKQHEYDQAQDFLFGTADQVIVDGKAGLIDAYSGVFRQGKSTEGGDYPERGDENHDGHVDRDGMNVEHIWPQSFFSKVLPMRSDMHHLMATFMHPNGVRGHLPFGEVRGGGDYSNSAGAKRGQGVFEPPNFAKGRVARAMLYFYMRYSDRNISNGAFGEDFWNSKLELLLKWNRQFPPTDWEKNRNDLVEKWQGNRNPFVDDHTLADQIGVEAFKRRARLQFHERARNQRRLRR